MSKYHIKVAAEFVFGLLGAAITAGLGALALQNSDNVSVALIVTAVTAGVNRFVFANLQNFLAALINGPTMNGTLN